MNDHNPFNDFLQEIAEKVKEINTAILTSKITLILVVLIATACTGLLVIEIIRSILYYGA